MNNGRGGFTLAELLVVLSIIALLIAMLVPSLKGAREQAKVLVCMTNVGGLARTSGVYHSQNNDWLVGAPGTSGSAVLRHPQRGDWAATDTHLPVDVLQPWDWATPMRVLDSVPDDRRDHYKLLFERYRCPNNRFVARPVIGEGSAAGPDWPGVQAPSYYALRQMLVWPNCSPSAPYGAATAIGAGIAGEGDPGDDDCHHNEGNWILPHNYAPRIERVGNPSQKVFLTDGSRWTDGVSGSITYNIEWNADAGGTFSTGGPSLHSRYLRDFWFPCGDTRDIAPITYRHERSGKPGIVVSFHDGHTAYLSEAQSRHPDPWWPRGTRLAIMRELNIPARKLVGPYSDFDTGYYTVR